MSQHMWEELERNFRKAELQSFGQWFDREFPSYWKKERMAQELQKAIFEKPSLFATFYSGRSLDFMEEIARQGTVQAQDLVEDPFFENSNSPEHDIEMLITGMGFFGLVMQNMESGEFALTPDALELIKLPGWRDHRREWYCDELSDCLMGILYSYGTMSVSDLKRIAARCYPRENPLLFELMLHGRVEIFMHVSYLDVDMEDGTPKQTWLEPVGEECNFAELRESLLRHHVLEQFRLYARKDYLRVAEDGVPRRPDNYLRLVKTLQRDMKLPEDDAEMLIYTLLNMRMMETKSTPDYLGLLMQFATPDRMTQDVVEELNVFMNDVPLWMLRGYSPNEYRSLLETGGKVLPFRRNP